MSSVKPNGLPRRLVQLYVGLPLYGVSLALMVRARLGLDPWDVLHQGIARHLGLQIGTVTIIVGTLVLLVWIPLRQRPGIGTLSNVVLIGLVTNWMLTVIPTRLSLGVRVAAMVGGILLLAVATGLYIGAHFGPGPRDGLMTGFARRTGRSIRLTRACIELSVLICGWLLGGTVGIGTVLYAVSIGPLVQRTMRAFDSRARADYRDLDSSVGLDRDLAQPMGLDVVDEAAHGIAVREEW